MREAHNDPPPPQRIAKKGLAKLSPELRREIARMGAITRRAWSKRSMFRVALLKCPAKLPALLSLLLLSRGPARPRTTSFRSGSAGFAGRLSLRRGSGASPGRAFLFGCACSPARRRGLCALGFATLRGGRGGLRLPSSPALLSGPPGEDLADRGCDLGCGNGSS